MPNLTMHVIESYMGTSCPQDFETESKIREYFSEENLTHMFGADADLRQSDEVFEWVLDQWGARVIQDDERA